MAAGYAIGFIGDSVCLSASRSEYSLIEFAVCSGIRARIKSVRLDGSDPHLCRSAWIVWVRHPTISHGQ